MPAGRAGMPWYAGSGRREHAPAGASKALWGYLFLLPWLLGLIVFWLGPMLASFYLSFTEYDVICDPRFVGLANYQRAFFERRPVLAVARPRTFNYAAGRRAARAGRLARCWRCC